MKRVAIYIYTLYIHAQSCTYTYGYNNISKTHMPANCTIQACWDPVACVIIHHKKTWRSVPTHKSSEVVAGA